MAPFATILRPLLNLAVLGTFAAMFSALIWFTRQVRAGRRVLPPRPERPALVPWGLGAVFLVMLSWLLVNLLVSAGYLALRGRQTARPRPDTVAVTSGVKILTPPGVKAEPAGPGGTGKAKRDRPRLSFGEQMFLVSLMNGVLILVVPLVLRVASGATRGDLGLTFERPGRDLKLGALVFLLVTPLVMAVMAFAQLLWRGNRHPVELLLRQEMSPGGIVLAYVSAVLLAPAAEELLFRGVLQAWLRRLFLLQEPTRSGPQPDPTGSDLIADPEVFPSVHPPERPFPGLPRLPAVLRTCFRKPGNSRSLPVVITSLLFAAVHAEQMPAPFAIFGLSLALGLLYERTESLIPPFVLHALFNGFNTTLMLYVLVSTPTW